MPPPPPAAAYVVEYVVESVVESVVGSVACNATVSKDYFVRSNGYQGLCCGVGCGICDLLFVVAIVSLRMLAAVTYVVVQSVVESGGREDIP
jgi:hypothetical protein